MRIEVSASSKTGGDTGDGVRHSQSLFEDVRLGRYWAGRFPFYLFVDHRSVSHGGDQRRGTLSVQALAGIMVNNHAINCLHDP